MTQLSKIDALDVIALTSVMQYAETERTIPDIGRELSVDIDPELADGHKALGLAYRVGGDDDSALVHYFRAVELNPRHFGAVANIGAQMPGRDHGTRNCDRVPWQHDGSR